MSISAEKTVREFALENPAATRVLEKLGVDYCCGASKSLEEACRAANLPIGEVVDPWKRRNGPRRSLAPTEIGKWSP